jgi:hypothetical protein
MRLSLDKSPFPAVISAKKSPDMTKGIGPVAASLCEAHQSAIHTHTRTRARARNRAARNPHRLRKINLRLRCLPLGPADGELNLAQCSARLRHLERGYRTCLQLRVKYLDAFLLDALLKAQLITDFSASVKIQQTSAHGCGLARPQWQCSVALLRKDCQLAPAGIDVYPLSRSGRQSSRQELLRPR